MGPDYGKTFALWREGAAGLWRDYTHHAFVEGLRDGTLPRAEFLHYLIQDYVFLIHFSRAWSLAVVKSETLEAVSYTHLTLPTNREVSIPAHAAAAKEKAT